MIRGLRDGLAYAWATPPVLLVLSVMLVVATVSINFNVLLPVLASHTLHAGAEGFGAITACFGAGALVGALLSATMARASWPVLLGGALALGAGELLLAPQTSLVPAMLILAGTGAAFSLFTSNSNSTLQLRVPDRLRGRVLSLYAYVFFGTAPLGGLLTGWLAARGTALALAVAGGTAALAAVGGMAVRRGGLPTERRRRNPAVVADEAAAEASLIA
jgi:MFS family permease